MSSTGNDFSHCLHGSPIVEKPRFSKDSKSIISICKSDANKKENPHRHIVDKSRWGSKQRARRVNPMSTPPSCFTNANPMPRKKIPPPTRRIAADGGNPWRYGAPTSYHGLTHANPMPRNKRTRSSAVFFEK